MEDNTGAPTIPAHNLGLPAGAPTGAPKRSRMSKPTTEGKRQRRTSTQARIALAMAETHLKGVYDQMELLEKAVTTLKEQLS